MCSYAFRTFICFLYVFQVTCQTQETKNNVDLMFEQDLSMQYLRLKYGHILSEIGEESVQWPNSSGILPYCQALVSEYSKQSSKFIKCSIDNARPFKFCEGCVVHYKKTMTVFQDIVENDDKFDNCKDLLLSSDRVQVINTVHQDIIGMWNSADCSKCFGPITEDTNGTVHYSLTSDTNQFLSLYSNFTHCIPKNINTTERNDTLCDTCRPYYREMNNLFDKLLNNGIESHHVCMDIVDIMNYTRLTWGNELLCTVTQKQRIPVIIMSCALFLIPVIFYSSMALYGTKKERTLMKQKRLSALSASNTFSHYSNEYLMGQDSSSSADSSRTNSRISPQITRPQQNTTSHVMS